MFVYTYSLKSHHLVFEGHSIIFNQIIEKKVNNDFLSNIILRKTLDIESVIDYFCEILID